MLWTFASQDEKASRAVQHARTLKIKYFSPMMALDPELFPIHQPDEPESREPASQDPSPSPPILIRCLKSAISSLNDVSSELQLSSFS